MARRRNLLYCAALGLLILTSAPVDVRAEMPFFDFSGYSYTVGPPGAVGSIVSSAARFNQIQPNPIWPLELGTTEYTVMVQDLVIGSVSAYGTFQEVTFSGGTIEVHADPAMNGTWSVQPPNGDVPSTFLDGPAELTGVFTEMVLFFDTATCVGTVSGLVNWTGGARLNGLDSPTGWTYFGGVSCQDGFGIPLGYDMVWDPQLYGPEMPNPVESHSWGWVKNTYRR